MRWPWSTRRTVAIFGRAGCKWEAAPPAYHERWIINDGWQRFTRPGESGWHWDNWDRAFDLHPLEHIRRKRPTHLKWLEIQSGAKPVYMLQAHDWIPGSVAYPREAVQRRFRLRAGEVEEYFTSSLDWLLALALYEGVSRVELYGVDMWDWGPAGAEGVICSERKEQREGGSYWIGRARGMGVDVWTEPGSSICRTEQLYGFWEPTGPDNFTSMSLARFTEQLKRARAKEAHGRERTPDAEQVGASQPPEATSA